MTTYTNESGAEFVVGSATGRLSSAQSAFIPDGWEQAHAIAASIKKAWPAPLYVVEQRLSTTAVSRAGKVVAAFSEDVPVGRLRARKLADELNDLALEG